MLPILLGAAVLFGSSPLGLIDPSLGQPKSKTVTYTFQGYCMGSNSLRPERRPPGST
jgi:hypothetical protein